MADIIQEITPGLGGLNWDDDYRFMDKNDSPYRLNVINNQFSSEFIASNMKGTTEYSHSFDHGSSYGGSIYTCIGDVYDDNRDAIYFFIYSDRGNHSILRFLFSDKSFEKIVWDHTEIGLDIDYPITDAYMIGDWLHFNPRTSSPRAVNVQWANWDFLCHDYLSGTSYTAGQYVRYNNKIYLVLSNIQIFSPPPFFPTFFRFESFCYQDTYPLNAATIDPANVPTPGEYIRFRPFYNIPTPLPYTPSAAVATDTAYEYNNIRGRRFQFCFRHYVPDQGYTITSSFTDIIAPPSSETNKGEVVGDIQAYNKITIGVPVYVEGGILNLATSTTTSTTTVIDDYDWPEWDMLHEFVEVLFREGPLDDWKIAEKVDHDTMALGASGSQYSLDFFNDKSYPVVDNVEIEKQYNPLPVLAKSQWSLDGERTAYGGVTEGLNTEVFVSASLTVHERELTLETPPAASVEEYAWNIEWNADIKRWRYYTGTITLDSVDIDDTLGVTINGIEYTHVLVSGEQTPIANYTAAIVDLLAQGNVVAYTSGSDSVVETYDRAASGFISSIFLYNSSVAYDGASKKFGSFKNGTWHPFCLFYYDDPLRMAEPVFNESMRVYVDTLTEALSPSESTNYQRYIDWQITHKPPAWAKFWRWGYAGNQTIDKFWQYNINEWSYQTKGTSADTWTRLDISTLQLINDDASGFDHFFPDTNIDAYSYVPGDRVRFITDNVDTGADYTDLSLMEYVKDYEIKQFDDLNHYIYIDEFIGPPSGTTTTTTTSPPGVADETMIIEIYRPKKQTGTTVYHEFGPLYSTHTDSGVLYHRGETADQDSGTTAKGQFNSGDVFVITRLFSKSPFTAVDNPVFVESDSWSDFHETDGWGKGKSGIFTGIGQKYLNNIRHGNRYSPNTRTSGLSTFDFLDYKEMSTDHGNITAMRQAGNTLKVYFERNTASVLVNKQQFYNADGTSQIVKSDNVLGDAVYSNYHYGTIFPESVFLKDRTVYFFDVYRKVFVRDSPNGIEPISDNKMRRYFDEKAKALLTSGVSNVQVHTTYDYDYDMVYVHFVDSVTEANDDVILYHEPQNRWVTFLQLTGNNILEVSTTTSSTTTSTSSTTSTTYESQNSGLIFGKGSMGLVSYTGEDIHLHNTNETRNNFWGVQRDSIVDIVSNEAANVIKTFENIAIHSNKPWDINFISLPAGATYTNGMQSKLPESRFRIMEEVYYANYLRNMKTNSSSASNLDLVRGETLRGYYIIHRLINDDTTEMILFKVDVSGSVSKI